MSKISKAAAEMSSNNTLRMSETVTNFMGGDSYTVDPLMRLRLVTSSSIFGEPSYYRDANVGGKVRKGYAYRNLDSTIRGLLISEDILGIMEDKEDTVSLMERVIDEALDYDFKGTLDWAVTLRNQYYIRLNPQVIMVRAAQHPKRKQFTSEYNGAFASINNSVMARPDDAMSQMSYFLYKNEGKKNAIPSILKRSWADKISGLSDYAVAKYKNAEIGMINAVRICHAHSPILDTLMRTGDFHVSEEKRTWENMRSEGKSWEYIFTHINMGHMAMLRNIRNFLKEVDNFELAQQYMDKLKGGVLSGKQFPFRYYSAYKAVKDCTEELHHKQLALDTLEECMDISLENMPKLKGKTMCLTDNSGSAWGGLTTEYGSVVVAEIDNLSSVITAMRSDEGYVGKFGDRLRVFPISKRRGVLEQTLEISKDKSDDIGGGTEGGIWEFFNNAIKSNEHWDNIFIYSDQQAGTGGLYGTYSQIDQYSKAGYRCSGNMINVLKLVLDYRKKVNPKVNVFSIQTAGFDNMVVPDYAYRTNLMYGWTGKEAIFANAVINSWDALDNAKKANRDNKTA